MEQPGGEPEQIQLADLEKEYYRLSLLVDAENEHLKKKMEVSIAAGDIVGLLYDTLLKQYIDKTSEHTLRSMIRQLCRHTAYPIKMLLLQVNQSVLLNS